MQKIITKSTAICRYLGVRGCGFILLFNKKFKAFSLIEVTISLIFIMCITACFLPVLTKKLTNMSTTATRTIMTNCAKFDAECAICTKTECVVCTKNCISGTLNFKTCKCH